MTSKPIQVVTTTDSRESAESLVTRLVEERLVACGQIDGPIQSVYRWQGVVEKAAEFRCTLKTDLRLFSRLEQRMRELHGYDVPEIIATEIVAGSEDYIQWLNGHLTD